MKNFLKIIGLLIFVVIFISQDVKAGPLYKPWDFSGPGYNGRLDSPPWYAGGDKLLGSWTLHNIRWSGEVFDWANWKCDNPLGNECFRGSWYTSWKATFSDPTWPLDDDGNPEPPLPNEPGTWIKIYMPYMPMHYDPYTNTYY